MKSRRIYWISIVFIIWFLILRFRVNLPNLLLCFIASRCVYYLSGVKSASNKTKPQTTDSSENLDATIALIEGQISMLKSTKLEPSVVMIRDNLQKIKAVLQSDPALAQNTYLRRFCALYAEYSKGLVAEYLTLAKVAVPSVNITITMQLYIDRFEQLQSITRDILDDIYGSRTMDMIAENKALEQVFAPLSRKGMFISSVGTTVPNSSMRGQLTV